MIINVIYGVQSYTYILQTIIQKEFDFEETKLPVKIRYIYKIERKNSIAISVFGYENKEKYPMYLSKKYYEEKYVDLLLKGEEIKRHYVLIKCLNSFMYDHILHRRKK